MNAAIKLKAAFESFEYELPVRLQLRLSKSAFVVLPASLLATVPILGDTADDPN